MPGPASSLSVILYRAFSNPWTVQNRVKNQDISKTSKADLACILVLFIGLGYIYTLLNAVLCTVPNISYQVNFYQNDFN